jgi:hypothetical protein
MELDLDVVDGRLEVVAPSRARVEEGPWGPRLVADAAEGLDPDQVRELVEQGRR